MRGKSFEKCGPEGLVIPIRVGLAGAVFRREKTLPVGAVAITVHSAYRPPEYNRSVGGVSNSAHIDGLAADISAAGISTEALHRVCEVIIGR